jgi:hypothetical protein
MERPLSAWEHDVVVALASVDRDGSEGPSEVQATRLSRATLVELDSRDHLIWLSDARNQLVDAVRLKRSPAAVRSSAGGQCVSSNSRWQDRRVLGGTMSEPVVYQLPRLENWYAAWDSFLAKGDGVARVEFRDGEAVLVVTGATKRGTGTEAVQVELPVADVLSAIGEAIRLATGGGLVTLTP